MEINPFEAPFAEKSNSELIFIIDNPGDYQPLAVDAARKIIDLRQLTPDQLAKANAQNESDRQEKLKQEEQYRNLENKAKSLGWAIFDKINPIRHKSLSADGAINLISLFLGVFFAVSLFRNYRLWIMCIEDINRWRMDDALTFIIDIAGLPVSTLLFWRRKKIGWIILSAFLGINGLLTMIIFIKEINTNHDNVIPALEIIFPRIPIQVYAGQLFMYFGILITICKRKIREVFTISIRNMVLTFIAVAAMLLFCFMMMK